uniref:Activator of Hsp90 ATPase homolog 1-like protein n=2 Tax=Caenorhabditis tropicalis TaxID=1561998 RepID=A0A1I7UHH8_9PELO
MFSDIDTNNLPNSWLMTISDSAEIKVCQGEESVEYTPDQFRSWYQRFGQMWHGNREEGKEEEYMKVHELHLEDENTERRKYGIEFMHCFTEITENEDMPKKFWIYDRFWNGTMIGYFNMYELTIPAAEDTYIVMRMKMKPPAETPVPGDIFGSDWKFYIKWDKMDQFYYFYKAEFSCPQYMKPGDGSFRVFSRHKGLGYYES